MEWDFTPTQVMTGEIEYTLDGFRHDLFNEIKVNFGERTSEDMLKRIFSFVDGYCHLRALMKTPEEIHELIPHIPKDMLDLTEKMNKENIEMLIGIYQRKFLDFYTPSLVHTFCDEKKAVEETCALVNLYARRTRRGVHPISETYHAVSIYKGRW